MFPWKLLSSNDQSCHPGRLCMSCVGISDAAMRMEYRVHDQSEGVAIRTKTTGNSHIRPRQANPPRFWPGSNCHLSPVARVPLAERGMGEFHVMTASKEALGDECGVR